MIAGGVLGGGVKVLERVDGGKDLKQVASLELEAPTGFLWFLRLTVRSTISGLLLGIMHCTQRVQFVLSILPVVVNPKKRLLHGGDTEHQTQVASCRVASRRASRDVDASNASPDCSCPMTISGRNQFGRIHTIVRAV